MRLLPLLIGQILKLLRKFILCFLFFSSPSVLDRLNPLLEPNGALSIDERGVIDGTVPTVKPHKDFR